MFDYQKYGAFKESAAPPQASRLKRLARALGLRHRYLRFLDAAAREQPLVEIGCGDGSFMRELQGAGFQRIMGIEPSPSYSIVVPAEFIVRGFAQDYFMRLAPGSIGTAVALDVFEHIPTEQLKSLLVLIEEKLRPGGLLMLRVPNMATSLGLYNYHGDLSHTTPLNEVSLRQIAFETAFTRVELHAEPLAYPRSLASIFGLLLWLPYKLGTQAVLAAFGIRARILTPNIVCVMHKGAGP